MKKLTARMYCEKCCHRDTCVKPCAPVEALLRSVETRDENNGELPRSFVEKLQADDEWPESGKTKKRLILELYFIDGREGKEIDFIVGCCREYRTRVINAEKRRVRSKAKPKYTIAKSKYTIDR
jgi:hypothetical protein